MGNRFAALPFGAMIESIENSSGRREKGGDGGVLGGMEGFGRNLKEGISLCRRGGGGCNWGLTAGLDPMPTNSILEISVSNPQDQPCTIIFSHLVAIKIFVFFHLLSLLRAGSTNF